MMKIKNLLPLTVLIFLYTTELIYGQDNQVTQQPQNFKVDERVKAMLDTMDYKYDLTKEGDFKLICKIDDERTQVVFVNSSTENFQNTEIREIFSPTAVSPKENLTIPFLCKLLEDSYEKKLGAWQMISGSESSLITFTVKVKTDYSLEDLNKIIWMVAQTADALEKEISPNDNY